MFAHIYFLKMASSVESIVTTDGSEQAPWNICFWDASTGAVQGVFKSGLSAQNCVAAVGNSYIISAQKDKPLLQVWELNKKEQLHLRMILPGKVNSLAVCPFGTYCVAAIQESFHLWMISSGQLLAVVTRHFQPITCIRFTDDGTHFLTAGEDGHVYLWALSNVLRPQGPSAEPIRTYQKHALQVTCLALGAGGTKARFATTSNDHTCRVYDLASGEVLVSFVLEVALTSVALDPAEYHLFLGAVDGIIYQVDLFNAPPTKDMHMSEEEKKDRAFSGHLKQVTSLSVSLDGNLLCSGSYDQSARLWHIPSRQCLRVFPHKGPVLNMFFMVTPLTLTHHDEYRANHLLAPFQRQLGPVHAQKNTVSVILKGSSKAQDPTRKPFVHKKSLTNLGKVCEPGQSKAELRDALQGMKKVNHQLYNYAVEAILNSLQEGKS